MAFSPFTIWEKSGITSHEGGTRATQNLIERCAPAPNSLLLDIGCGTGYTASTLAHQHRMIALDRTARVLTTARQRMIKHQLHAGLLQGDAHCLPFDDHTFDGVIVESVLIFCDQQRAAIEIERVLKSGGFYAGNELTLLKPPPPDLMHLLCETLHLKPLLEGEWRTIFEKAGFTVTFSAACPLNLRIKFADHLKIDSLLDYLKAVYYGLSDRQIRATFFNREVLKAARQFRPYLGYGLYISRKN